MAVAYSDIPAYLTYLLPHPTSSYTGFFCHPTPTLSYLILPHPTRDSSTILPRPTLSYPILPHPTSSYTGFFCQPTPTLSYLILPHATLYTTAILPHPTSSYTGFFCHPTPSYFILSHRTTSYPVLPQDEVGKLQVLPTQFYQPDTLPTLLNSPRVSSIKGFVFPISNNSRAVEECGQCVWLVELCWKDLEFQYTGMVTALDAREVWDNLSRVHAAQPTTTYHNLRCPTLACEHSD